MRILGVNPFLIAFTILPIVVAVIHRKPQTLAKAVSLLIVYSALCWALLFAALAWNDMQWKALINSTPNPSIELVEQFNSDGASKAFTMIFGFPFSLMYSGFIWILFRGAQRIWAAIKGKMVEGT